VVFVAFTNTGSLVTHALYQRDHHHDGVRPKVMHTRPVLAITPTTKVRPQQSSHWSWLWVVEGGVAGILK